MRVARFSLYLAVTALFVIVPLALSAVAHAADAAPHDSSLAAPDSVYTIHFAKGDSIKVRYVGYWGAEMVRYQTLSGETGYLTANKIRTIKDEKGKDYLDEIFWHKSAFGDAGPDTKGEFKKRSLAAFLARPFRASPIRERHGYFLGEFGISGRMGDGRSTGDNGALYHTGIGGVKNLDRDWGLGGLVALNTDGGGYRSFGAGLRLLRYLNDDWSLDGTLGAFSDDDRDDRHMLGIQSFVEFAVSGASAVSLFGRLERHHYSVTRYFAYSLVLAEDAEVSENALHFGVRLGPRPGYISVPAMMLGVALMTSGGTRSSY